MVLKCDLTNERIRMEVLRSLEDYLDRQISFDDKEEFPWINSSKIIRHFLNDWDDYIST